MQLLCNFNNNTLITHSGALEEAISMVTITLSEFSFVVTVLRSTDDQPMRWAGLAMDTLVVFAIPTTVIPFVQCKPIARTFVDLFPETASTKYLLFAMFGSKPVRG